MSDLVIMKYSVWFPNLVKVSWQGALESSRVMMSRFKTVMLSLTDGLTKEQCIAAHLFWVACRRLGKRSGWLFLALYLRQSRVCLQRFVARDSIPSDLSPAVSLTRSGLPRIIPSFHRRKIREGNHLVIQLYMSFFTVSRLIPLAKKIDKSLFDSIITPGPLESVKDVIYEMKSSFPGLLERYIPDLKSIPLNQGLEYSDFAFLTRYPGGFRTSIKRDTISPGPAFYHAYFIYLLSYLGLPDSSPPPRQAWRKEQLRYLFVNYIPGLLKGSLGPINLYTLDAMDSPTKPLFSTRFERSSEILSLFETQLSIWSLV